MTKQKSLARRVVKAERKMVEQVLKAPMRKRSKRRRADNGRASIVQRISMPAAYAHVVKTKSKDRTYTYPGDDFLASVQVTAANVQDGDLLFAAPIAPQMFENARVAELAKTFAKYRFTRFEVSIGGNLSTNINGGFIAGISPDPAIEISAGVSAKNEIMGWSGSVRSAYYSMQKARLSVGKATKWLNTSQSTVTEQGQSINVQQGILVIVADGLVSGVTGSFSLPVSVDYEIQFDEPVSRPQQNTGSTFSFTIEYDPQGAPFKILDAAGSSGLDTVSNYYPSANNFVQNILTQMQPYSQYVYKVSPPLTGAGYYQSPSDLLPYCWREESGNKVYFTDKLATAFADAATYSGAGTFFAWPSPDAGNIVPYTFTAIPNPLQGVKGPATIQSRGNNLEFPAPTTGSTTVYASGTTLQSSDTDWYNALEAAMMPIDKGAYSISTNPAPGAWFSDGTARNIIVRTGSNISFSNDIADVFSGSPTYAVGSGTTHDWAGLAGGLELNFIEAPTDSVRRGIALTGAPNVGQEVDRDGLHFRVAQIAASHNTLTEAINNLASKIALLEAQV